MADEVIIFDAKLHASGGPVSFGELENPNRMPFSGVLTYLDIPSDLAPGGSGGKKVLIPLSVGQAAIESLIGTPVNLAASMDDHDQSAVLGVFDAAWIGEVTEKGTPLNVEGHIFAKAFPDEAAAIKASQDTLGFSYETSKTKLVSGVFGDDIVAVAESLIFTGAAILYKHVAAYKSTSLAASAEGGDNLPNEDVQKILDAIAAVKEYVDAKFSLLAEQEWVKDIYKYVDDAYDRVEKAADAVEEAIEEAGGTSEEVEVDITVNVLAGKGEIPEENPAVAALTELVATIQKELTELKAAKETELAAAAAQQPKRLSLNSTQLTAKFDKKNEAGEVIASIDAKNLPTSQSFGEKLAILFPSR